MPKRDKPEPEPFSLEKYKKRYTPAQIRVMGLGALALVTAMEAHPSAPAYVKAANRASTKLASVCHDKPGRRAKRAIFNTKAARVSFE